ncbi:hypothetical protein ACQY1Y_09960 [Microcystis ichthyoblabe FBCC-A1114]|jgi:hypothetical protein|uniref:hypothetical protein n=1 Tax=Microcystis TaxID=1125 RepID=UPI002580F2F5|nr:MULTISPECIES: hypothetical protein [unclassified Microcystis]MCA2625759.1 hypothetical protein [Microcystis sp. M19BS1]MCA2633849.1 hypothetical protein [Microcystis sp. M20BS1]
MENRQPLPEMEVEATFNEFVEDLGGELISKLFEGKGKRPNNADYFFCNRTVVAELKCLEKNYFNDRKVGDKLNLMMHSWITEGLLRQEHIKDGRFQIDDLPRQCAVDVFKVFSSPTKEAVEKANKQIKETKKYFRLPDAKGLLILANDGNYSIPPNFMMYILGNLLASRYTSIDSFIFFTPNMRAYAPQIDRQFNVWISGRTRPSSNAVESDLLHHIQQSWVSFLERKFGEVVTQFHIKDHNVVDSIKLVQ